MKPTKDMVTRFQGVGGGCDRDVTDGMTAALEGYELAPFSLTENVASIMRSSPSGNRELALMNELRRAQRVLVPKHGASRDTGHCATVHRKLFPTYEELLAECCAKEQRLIEQERGVTFELTEAEQRALEGVDNGELSHGCTLAAAVRRAVGTTRCTCRIVGNLQMSAGCALHGEGEEQTGEWTESERDAVRCEINGATHRALVAHADPYLTAAHATNRVLDILRPRLTPAALVKPSVHHLRHSSATACGFNPNVHAVSASSQWEHTTCAACLKTLDDPRKHQPAAPVQAGDYSEEQIAEAAKIAGYFGVRDDGAYMVRRILAAASVPAQPSEDALHKAYLQGAESVRSVELVSASEHQKVLMNRNAELLHQVRELEAKLAAAPVRRETFRCPSCGDGLSGPYTQTEPQLYEEGFAAGKLAAAPVPVEDLMTQPFVMSDDETAAMIRAENDMAGPADADRMAAALRRACHTLTPAAVEPLSDNLRIDAELILGAYGRHAHEHRVAAELLRRCPKPEPKRRSARELAEVVRAEWESDRGVNASKQSRDALSELEARAEQAESKVAL